jgi:hypothetical protein
VDPFNRRHQRRVNLSEKKQITAAIRSEGIITSLRYVESRRIATTPATMADALQAATAAPAELARIRLRRPTSEA